MFEAIEHVLGAQRKGDLLNQSETCRPSTASARTVPPTHRCLTADTQGVRTHEDCGGRARGIETPVESERAKRRRGSEGVGRTFMFLSDAVSPTWPPAAASSSSI